MKFEWTLVSLSSKLRVEAYVLPHHCSFEQPPAGRHPIAFSSDPGLSSILSTFEALSQNKTRASDTAKPNLCAKRSSVSDLRRFRDLVIGRKNLLRRVLDISPYLGHICGGFTLDDDA